MTELWVASDRVNGAVYLYHAKPTDNGKIFDTPGSPIFDVEDGAFPDLKSGERRRLVMAEDQ
jgi:hypothetical protein